MTSTRPGDDRTRLADFLRAVPGPTGNSAPLADLCARSGVEAASAHTVLVLARALAGAVVTVRGAPGDENVQASTTIGWYFLKSLAEYVAEDSSVFNDWERLTVRREEGNSLTPPSGPRLLYLMENRRLERHNNAPCLREIQVAQVIIKAHRKGPGDDLYLVQYDDGAQDFQLTGGVRRSSDADLGETAIRELEEELPGFHFNQQSDYLRSMGRVQVPQISHTYGVATRYDVEIFHLRTDRPDVPTTPTARWFTEAEMLTTDSVGASFNMTALRQVMEQIDGGLECLPASLTDFRNRPRTALTDANLWEIVGVILGIIGIAVSVVFYFLT